MTFFKPALTVVVISLIAPFAAYADAWSCRHDNDVREVHMVQTTEAPVPCQVVYKKLTEGAEDQVLWNAQNDAAYCEEKAAAFVEKLEGLGWTCVETIQDEAAAN